MRARLGVGTAILPAIEGGGEEHAAVAVGLGDDSRQAVIREKRVKGTADTVGVVVSRLVGEAMPLGGLVNGVELEDEVALGVDDVAGGVARDGAALRANGARRRHIRDGR
ncbi:hypothetical protein LR48_Vigan01g041900 [Vigna angularis]|uniref:Uncharacterized protein n=1 Tax=Phaseolus angularis TaxID=3914 RepID=A0A0L9TL32_PHAAN|nr:hypothetical protein LR48_Vigan01g041900 [Vigna angularis]